MIPIRINPGESLVLADLEHQSAELFDHVQLHTPFDLLVPMKNQILAAKAGLPKRWHVEEFFNAHQALGWDRAGTMNLHIRYGQMTMALIAQAALHRLRRRLAEPYSEWDAGHLATKSLLAGLEGDVRVSGNRIVVTYYNAPNAEQLRRHYDDLPKRLAAEHVDSRIPWLYGYELDFRFR